MKRRIFSKVVFYILIILAVFLFALPILHMALSSFKPSDELISMSPTLIPRSFTLENYIMLQLLTPTFHYFRNSVIAASLVALFTVTFSVYTAYLLTRFRIRGLAFFSKMVLLFYALPDVILGIGFYLVFSRIGLLNNYLSLTLGQSALAIPFCIWMLWAYFRQIPIELDEAAAIDGASRFQILRKVIFPCLLYTSDAADE